MPLGLYMPEHAALMADQAGQKWRPSNGTEGDLFTSRWCDECVRNMPGLCSILAATMVYEEDSEHYPSEWQHGDDGQPKCAAFEPANT